MRKVALVFIYIFVASFAFAEKIISLPELEKELSNAVSTNRADLLNRASREYWFTDPDKALELANEAKGLSAKLGYRHGVCLALRNLGGAYNIVGLREKSLSNLSAAIELANEIGYTEVLANSFHMMGMWNLRDSNYEKALGLLTNAKKNYVITDEKRNGKDITIKRGLLIISASLVDLYTLLGEYEKAIGLYKDSRKILDEHEVLKSYSAYFYERAAKAYSALGDKDEAQKTFNMAYEAAKRLNEIRNLISINASLAKHYYKYGENTKSLESIDECLSLIKESGRPYYESAVVVLELKSKIYASRNDYKPAYEALSKYHSNSDKLRSESYEKALEKSERMIKRIREENKLNEIIRDNKLLSFRVKKDRQLIIMFILLALLGFGAAVYVFISLRKQTELNDELHKKNIAIYNESQALAEAKEEKERLYNLLLKSVHRAQELQKHITPKQIPAINGLDCAALFMPSAELSGDIFNLIKLDDNRLVVLLGDCTGHGLEASTNSILLKSVSDRYLDAFKEGPNCAEYLTKVNEAMLNYVKEAEYPLLFAAHIDSSKQEITYANANAEYPFFIKGDGSSNKIETVQGFHLGFLELEYEQKVIKYEIGDSILFYSDALVEYDKTVLRDEAYRFVQGVFKGFGTDANENVDNLFEALRKKVHRLPLEDDLTLVHICFNDKLDKAQSETKFIYFDY